MAPTLQVVDTLDAIGANAGAITGVKRAMVYITGTPGIQWTPEEIAALAKRGVQTVLRIDQTNSVLPFSAVKVLIKDIEPGASSIVTAINEARERLSHGLITAFYLSISDLAHARTLAGAGQRYVVADWNLSRAEAIAYMEANPDVVGVQYESLAQIDKSVFRADWPAPLPVKHPVVKKVVKKVTPSPKVRPHPKVVATTTAGALTAIAQQIIQNFPAIAHISPQAEGAAIVLLSALAGYLTPSKKS